MSLQIKLGELTSRLAAQDENLGQELRQAAASQQIWLVTGPMGAVIYKGPASSRADAIKRSKDTGSTLEVVDAKPLNR